MDWICRIMALAFCLGLGFAARAEEAPFNAAREAPHFMSLAPLRNGTVIHGGQLVPQSAGLKTVPVPQEGMTLPPGFMRFDRGNLRPQPRLAAISAADAVAAQTHIIRPARSAADSIVPTRTGNPIADLFGTNAPVSTNFRDALLNTP